MWIAGALLVSHGVASWLGKSWPREDELAGRHAAAAAAGTVNSSASMPMTLAGLQERVRQRAAEKQAAADELALHPWREQVAAARAKIPAGADLAALVKKGMAEARRQLSPADSPEADELPLSAETCAAFGLWLAQDAGAALRWLELNKGDGELVRLEAETKLWLEEGGRYRQLARLMEEYPLSAEALRGYATEVAAQAGPDALLEMAGTLPGPVERAGTLSDWLRGEPELAGRIAGLLALMREGKGPQALFDLLARRDDFDARLEEIRAAGFPPEVLARYDEKRAEEQQPAGSMPGLGDSGAMAGDSGKEVWSAETLKDPWVAEQGPDWWKNDVRSVPKSVREALPEADEWCQAVREGRMPMEELITQARAEWPEGAAKEEELRIALAWQFMPERPLETLEWLAAAGVAREKFPELWKNRLNLEQITQVLREYPGGYELGGEEEVTKVSERFLSWYLDDPVASRTALKEFPDERVREQAAGMIGAAQEQEKKEEAR